MNIEKFYKLFNEVKETYSKVDYVLEYKTFWHMTLSVNNKMIFDLRNMDAETIFDTALHKLNDYLRR